MPPFKKLLVAGFCAILAASPVPANTITYSVTGNQTSSSSVIQGGFILPLFDPLSPEIPDDAALTGVKFRISDTTQGFVHIFNNTGVELTFTGHQAVNVSFINPATGLILTHQQDFPFAFSSVTGGLRSFSFEHVFDHTDPNINAYKATQGGLPFVNWQKDAVEGLFLNITPAPGPSIDHHPNITVLSELSRGSTTIEVTYTYSVPDAGTTFSLLALALAVLAAVRHRRNALRIVRQA